jgi:nucleoside-diphosphate kinase
VVKRFENRGFKILGMKMMQLDENILKEHYFHVADKPFFSGIVKYMTKNPIVAMAIS